MSMFSEQRVQKFTYNTATDVVTTNTVVTIGYLPANALITNGWSKVTATFSDANAGDDTTIALGYTGVAAGFFPATACGSFTNNLLLKLIPGVLNIGDSQVITTVDTPAEIVAVARVSGNTHSLINLTAYKAVLLTIGNDVALDAGSMDIYIEYVISE